MRPLKHSPTPWQPTKAIEDNVYCIVDRHGIQVARFTNPNAEGNVNLAVLAPKLLETLETIEYKTKRATVTHDKDCPCATCETYKDANKIINHVYSPVSKNFN